MTMKNRTADSVMKMLGAVSELMTSLSASTMAMAPLLYTGPEMPPSLRTRQKWTAIRMPATSGMPTQCRT
jgi:hypothetical protein